jgi:predicted RNA methylase
LKNTNIDLSKEFSFFPTPKELVLMAQELLEINNNNSLTILEPSCGTGNLLDGIENINRIYCNEYNSFLADILRNKFIHVDNKPFEEYKSDIKFDRIIMNPPFEKRMDAKHILKAFNEHLKDGGILVAIHSVGILNCSDKYSLEFQELSKNFGAYQEIIESGTFKESGKGTNIETCITKFIKK